MHEREDEMFTTFATSHVTDWFTGLTASEVCMFLGTLIIAGLLTTAACLRLWRGRATASAETCKDPFAAAYVTDGPHRAILVAFVTLNAHGLLQPSSVQGAFVATPAVVPPADLHPVEHAVLAACKPNPQTVASIASRDTFKKTLPELEKTAINQGMLRRKPNLATRIAWASPLYLAAGLAVFHTATSDFSAGTIGIAALGAIGFGLGIAATKTPTKTASRSLISASTDQKILGDIPKVTTKPSAQTYRALHKSPLPALAATGGVIAVSSHLGYWSDSDHEMFESAQTFSTSASPQIHGGSSYGGDSGPTCGSSGGSDGSDGGGCGGGCGGA